MTYEDIYFMKSNESKQKVQVDDKTKERIKLLQSIDYRIYDHFTDLLYEVVKEEGVTNDHVAQFIEENECKTTNCTDGKQILGGFGTFYFVLTESGKRDFVCRAMNSRDNNFAKEIGRRNSSLKLSSIEKYNGEYLTLQQLIDWRLL